MTHNLSNSYKIKIRGCEGKTLGETVPNQAAENWEWKVEKVEKTTTKI